MSYLDWYSIEKFAKFLYDADTHQYETSEYYMWEDMSAIVQNAYISSILMGGRTDDGYSVGDFDA